MILADANPDPTLWPAVIGVLGIVVGALITWLLARRGEAVDHRRNGYADAMEALVAYVEYPFRIRRRTSDAPAVIGELASLGHDIQQRLCRAEAWIVGESGAVGTAFAEVRLALAALVGPACNDAWTRSPVTTAGGMNLGNWGPDLHRSQDTARAVREGYPKPLRRSSDHQQPWKAAECSWPDVAAVVA